MVELKKVAPELERWEVIAFRQRRHPLHPIGMSETMLNPEQVEVSLAMDGNMICLYIFMPDAVPKAARPQLRYLLLDEALGEYDVQTGLGVIEFEAKSSKKGW